MIIQTPFFYFKSENSTDSKRGSIALASASRVIRLLYKPTEDTMKKFDIPEEDRRFLVAESQGKDNLSEPEMETTISTWYKMYGQGIGNQTETLEQDFIGVSTAYEPPSFMDDVTELEIKQIMSNIRTAKETDRRASDQATGWIGDIIIDTLGYDQEAKAGDKMSELEPEAQTVRKLVKKMILRWSNTGTLIKGKTKLLKANGSYGDTPIYTHRDTVNEEKKEEEKSTTIKKEDSTDDSEVF